MPDDAPQPPPSFYSSPSRFFSRLTHFIDDNIRIIQYGVYCVGAAGVVLALHSVKAFTKFVKIQDIPSEFISKHVRLHGHVRWVGVRPPTLGRLTHAQSNISQSAENGAKHPPFSISAAQTEEKASGGGMGGRSLSADNRGIYEGAGELHPWEDGIDPALDRIQYTQDLAPLFIEVEHSPVFSIIQRKTDKLLPLQLADVEVTEDGEAQARERLLGRRVWFTLLSHNAEDNTLVCFLRPAKMLTRNMNEQLVREGLGLVGAMDLRLHGDPQYTKLYTRLLRAQEYAEKKQLGIWVPPKKQRDGVLTRLWRKMRSVVVFK